METRIEALAAAFQQRFGGEPTVLARAPGRVNLIGAHTDDHGGFVLPIAIDRDTWIALRPRRDGRLRLWNLDADEGSAFALDAIAPAIEGHWSNYLRGVAAHMAARQPLTHGFDGVMQSTVPVGSGLASSSAMVVATALALAATNELRFAPHEIAAIAQQAESAFVGVESRLMDQFIAAGAQRDHALLLDCRSLTTEHIPIPDGLRFVVSDSGVRRATAGVAARERRAACQEAAAAIGVPSLREVTPEILDAAILPHEIRKRARHVVEENGRVLAAVEALRSGNKARLGALVAASHASLRDLYELSIPELDLLVGLAEGVSGCYGARLIGNGFGGSTLAIVEADAAPTVAATITHLYPERSGYPTQVYIFQAAPGATVAPFGTE